MQLMQRHDIEQIPVLRGGEPVGAITQRGLFKRLMAQGDLREHKTAAVMDAPLPVVAMDMPIDRLGRFLDKGNDAALTKDDTGSYHIVTSFDLLAALSKG